MVWFMREVGNLRLVVARDPIFRLDTLVLPQRPYDSCVMVTAVLFDFNRQDRKPVPFVSLVANGDQGVMGMKGSQVTTRAATRWDGDGIDSPSYRPLRPADRRVLRGRGYWSSKVRLRLGSSRAGLWLRRSHE